MRRTVFLLSLVLFVAFVASITSSQAGVPVIGSDDVQMMTVRSTMAIGPPGDITSMFQDQQMAIDQLKQDNSATTISAYTHSGKGPFVTAMIDEQTTTPRLQESREHMDAHRLARDGI